MTIMLMFNLHSTFPIITRLIVLYMGQTPTFTRFKRLNCQALGMSCFFFFSFFLSFFLFLSFVGSFFSCLFGYYSNYFYFSFTGT